MPIEPFIVCPRSAPCAADDPDVFDIDGVLGAWPCIKPDDGDPLEPSPDCEGCFCPRASLTAAAIII